MEELVKLDNGKPITSSLLVSEKFGKDHKNVLRSIRELTCSQEFRQLNFAPSAFINSQNKEMPCYIMTRDGFTFLAMGFTGKEAGKFKEDFIEAFNKMETSLKQIKPDSDRLDRLEKMVENLIQLTTNVLSQPKSIEIKQDYYTILAYCRLNNIQITFSEAIQKGKIASKLSKENNIEMRNVPDERYGYVHSYFSDILKQTFQL
jgi:Rha family phage regulatory protein